MVPSGRHTVMSASLFGTMVPQFGSAIRQAGFPEISEWLCSPADTEQTLSHVVLLGCHCVLVFSLARQDVWSRSKDQDFCQDVEQSHLARQDVWSMSYVFLIHFV